MEGSGESDLPDGSRRRLLFPSSPAAAAAAAAGGDGAGRNRLAIPDTTIPGWRPSRGASSDTVPRILWRKGYPLAGFWLGIKTISAARRPPIE